MAIDIDKKKNNPVLTGVKKRKDQRKNCGIEEEKVVTECKDIQILIFSISGVKLGIDMEQILEIRKPDQVKRKKNELVWFHEKIPFRGDSISYKSPMVILPKDAEAVLGIIIDQPEDILPVSINSIQPLPPLMEKLDKSSPIWGVVLREEHLILLVDLYKLLVCNTLKSEENA